MQVLVRDNNVDQALKVLKKKMQREGVFREMKLRGHYEKPSAGKKYREHLLEIRLCFEITTLASIHRSGLRKLNNFCSIVTLGLETKVLHLTRWWHLALRKPATSRSVAGRYGSHRWHNDS